MKLTPDAVLELQLKVKGGSDFFQFKIKFTEKLFFLVNCINQLRRVCSQFFLLLTVDVPLAQTVINFTNIL